MRTSRPWPLRSPSHRPAAVGEAAAGILTPPAGCLHDTAGVRRHSGQPYGHLLRSCAASSQFGRPAPGRLIAPVPRVPATGTTTDPPGKLSVATIVPPGHHARDRAARSPIRALALVPAVPGQGGSRTHCSGWAPGAGACPIPESAELSPSLAVFWPRLPGEPADAACHGLGTRQIPPVRYRGNHHGGSRHHRADRLTRPTGLPGQDRAGPGYCRFRRVAGTALPSASPH